jgi:8-oxo-dGTP pyrophosphatase MutT (NUDIX family)
MQSGELYQRLAEQLQSGLPGKEAQYLMAPFRRQQREIEALAEGKVPKEGGVLVYLYPVEENEYRILLTLRNDYKGVHSGQVSFPGGKKEPQDLSLYYTSLREAEEETGVKVMEPEVLGPMTDLYIPPSNFMVHPLLAMSSQTPELKPDPVEVKRIVPFTIQELLDQSKVKSAPMQVFNNMTVDVPYFDVDGLRVWGATAMILSELKELIKKVWD